MLLASLDVASTEPLPPNVAGQSSRIDVIFSSFVEALYNGLEESVNADLVSERMAANHRAGIMKILIENLVPGDA